MSTQKVFSGSILKLQLVLVLCSHGAVFVACDDGPTAIIDNDSDGDGDADSVPDVDDADPDGEFADADTPETPLRRLTTRPLFGQMPIDNGFFDPQFGQIDYSGWVAVTGEDESDPGEIVRIFPTHTPLEQPALLMPALRNPEGLLVLGMARSRPGPVSVSVWTGRPVGSDDPEVTNVEIGLLGLFPDAPIVDAIDLTLDERVEAQELDGIVWRQYNLSIENGPEALCYLSIRSTVETDLYVSSPILISPDPPYIMSRPLRTPQARHRPLNTFEQLALSTVRRRMRDRFISAQKLMPTPEWHEH